MNFIESLLHLDPDGGSGAFEVAMILTVAVGVAVAGLAAARRARISRR